MGTQCWALSKLRVIFSDNYLTTIFACAIRQSPKYFACIQRRLMVHTASLTPNWSINEIKSMLWLMLRIWLTISCTYWTDRWQTIGQKNKNKNNVSPPSSSTTASMHFGIYSTLTDRLFMWESCTFLAPSLYGLTRGLTITWMAAWQT